MSQVRLVKNHGVTASAGVTRTDFTFALLKQENKKLKSLHNEYSLKRTQRSCNIKW